MCAIIYTHTHTRSHTHAAPPASASAATACLSTATAHTQRRTPYTYAVSREIENKALTFAARCARAEGGGDATSQPRPVLAITRRGRNPSDSAGEGGGVRSTLDRTARGDGLRLVA